MTLNDTGTMVNWDTEGMNNNCTVSSLAGRGYQGYLRIQLFVLRSMPNRRAREENVTQVHYIGGCSHVDSNENAPVATKVAAGPATGGTSIVVAEGFRYKNVFSRDLGLGQQQPRV